MPGTCDPASSNDPKGDGDEAMQQRVETALRTRIPLLGHRNDREILQLGQNDAVFVVRLEQMREEMVVFEPRREEVHPFRVPLIPIGHVGAEARERRPVGADDECEKAAREQRAAPIPP